MKKCPICERDNCSAILHTTMVLVDKFNEAGLPNSEDYVALVAVTKSVVDAGILAERKRCIDIIIASCPAKEPPCTGCSHTIALIGESDD